MSKRYSQIEGDFNFAEREADVSVFWDDNSIFQKSLDQRKSSPRFIFYEGPPTANGFPHIGHALARTVKDTVCRYKTMKGFLAERKAGWDTHGLPVELEVEKKLGIESKDEIEKYGIAKFNEECKKSVFKYKTEWDEYTRKLGYWLDLSNPYVTYSNDYIETVWWILRQFWEKELLYKGYKILPWCPRCQTALSSHETAQGYKEVTDLSLFVTMKLADSSDTYFLVWTTTPWTLISNVAVALHPDETYVTILHNDKKLILAKNRLSVIEGEYGILESKSGSEFVGVKYEPLFDFMPVEKGHFALNADFVTMEDGSGIVHMAPAFGADDYEIGNREGLSFLQAVDTEGKFISEITPWAGMFVKKADPKITKDLDKRGLLYKSEGYTHNYPFCWRCESPLIYYARSSWYIKTTSYKDKMIEANSGIKWYPAEVGSGRLGKWLENNVDWALSRERYWGTPLPIWICDSCGKKHCIGSIDELKKMAVETLNEIDLHRPYVDKIKLKCPDCGENMHRTLEVVDAWFDSGSMPYAQVHYPFENKDDFEEKYFPAEFIAEGLDQTRGWFYTMLAISVFISGRSSYKSCVVNNLVLDSKGLKMSKRLGNFVDPKQFLNEFGADVLRWYLMTSSQVWLPKKFDKEALVEVMRRFFSTLQNIYSFFAMYANIDDFIPVDNCPIEERPLIDRWIVSKTNSLINDVTIALDDNDITKATRDIANFVVDDLSNWYVRRNRRRYWGSQDNKDKKLAYQTLYDCLVTVCKLAAPIAPFMSEDLYRRLTADINNAPESVHLCDYPVFNEELIDLEIEEQMAIARQVVEIGRSARKESKVRVRQPLGKLIVLGLSAKQRELLGGVEDIVLDEINIKGLAFDSDEGAYFYYTAKPDFKKIGPKFGAQAKEVAQSVKNFSAEQVSRLISDGKISFGDGPLKFEVSIEDVKINILPHEGFSVGAEGNVKAALDLYIDEDLLAEGNARELVNKIQNLRKSAGLDVTDRITLSISDNSETQKALKKFAKYIKSETLTDKITDDSSLENDQEFDLNGVKTIVALEKI